MRTRNSAGRWFHDQAERLERNPRLDLPAERLQRAADAIAERPALHAFLKGRWLGHSFHPMATDFPLGSWMSASLLDLIGGEEARGPSRKLVAFGVLAAIPTAAAGLTEWRETREGARRVGVVHAATNTTALSLYTLSLVARFRERHRVATVLGVAWGIVATVGGYWGGHLSLEKAVGVNVEKAAADADDVKV